MPNTITYPERLTRPVALRGIAVVPMDANRILQNQTLIAEDGKITTLGPAAEVPLDGVDVIDARGKYVMPGLADMHVHYWDQGEAAMFLANGVTTVRNMWGDPLHRAIEESNRRGDAPGPHLITTSPLLDGLSEEGRTLWNGSNYIDEPDRAERFVRRYAAQGFTQIKVYSQLDHGLLAALGRAADDQGVRLVGHCPSPMTFEEAIDAGMRCFEHLTNVFFGHLNEGVASPKSVRWDSKDYVHVLRAVVEQTHFDAIRRLAGLMAEREVWNCPTTTVWQGGIPENQDPSDPRLDYMPPSTGGWWLQENHMTEERARLSAQAVDQRLNVLRILREEGAPVMVGTDTPNPFCFQGFSIHDEIDNFLAAGFSPYEALRAATSEAARFAGESSEWGTIAEGMRADLVMVARNPLDDVRVLRHPDAVLTNGYYLSREDLDLMLSERSKTVKEVPEVEAAHVDHDHAGRHLSETQNGRTTARICCKAIPLNGGLLLEENRAADGTATTHKIFLGPDRKLEKAEKTSSSPFGEESFAVERTPTGYRASVKGVDGFESHSQIETEPLYPSEAFGVTAVAEVLSVATGDGLLSTLSIDHDELTMVEASVEHKEDGEIVIGFRRKGTPSEQTYRLDASGKLAEVREGGWAPRQIIADEEFGQTKPLHSR